MPIPFLALDKREDPSQYAIAGRYRNSAQYKRRTFPVNQFFASHGFDPDIAATQPGVAWVGVSSGRSFFY
jgi:hypothetical protein